MKGFLIDLNRCNGCYNCQIVCKDEHCDQPWLPYSEAQPQVGQFWMNVVEKERGQFPLVRVSHIPTMCQHCQDAPCVAAAPEGVFERREDGLLILKPVKLDPEVAKRIAEACPVGCIFLNDELGIAQKCNGCAHLLDDGWEVPRCVDACCTDAFFYGEIEDFGERWSEGEPLNDRVGSTNSLVRYIGLPKRFMGGTVIDSRVNEVVIGAQVRAQAEGACEIELATNEFGDWYFDQVDPGKYVVSVSAEGYESKAFEVDLTEEDKYAGVCDLASTR